MESEKERWVDPARYRSRDLCFSIDGLPIWVANLRKISVSFVAKGLLSGTVSMRCLLICLNALRYNNVLYATVRVETDSSATPPSSPYNVVHREKMSPKLCVVYLFIFS